jgi:arsenate reductase
VNPRAIAVLQELGIETGYLRSKSVAEFLARDDLDLVITVCDHAKESCPVFLKPVRQVHIGFEDPAPYTDAPDAIALPKFRETRDQIREMLLKSLSV